MANQDQFFGMMLPYAIEASKLTGIDPRIIVAQSALETGYGKSAPGNNYFGIKSHGKGGGNTLATTEVIDGKPVRINDSFRAYGSPRDSALGYAEFINNNPRYGKVKAAQGFDAQVSALGASGYATDPNYANKVRSIAAQIPFDGAPIQASPYASMADGPKGQESYQAPASAPMMAGGDLQGIPAAVQKLASGGSAPTGGASDIFGMLAAMPQPQQQMAAPPIQGPTPQQANGLLQLVQALKTRMA